MKWTISAFVVITLVSTLFLGLTAQAAPSAPITVTTTADTIADDGECSLREAIQAANTDTAVGGCAAGEDSFLGDTIAFAIPGQGPHTIALKSALPVISSPVNIDGLSQEGAFCVSNIPARRGDQVAQSTALMIELDGSALASGYGLVFAEGAEFSNVQGLAINRFPWDGIQIRTTDAAFGVGVFCNFIGADVSGTAIAGNGNNGISILASSRNSIQSNVIAGNDDWGIHIEGSEAVDNRIEDNYIGTNASGADLGNGRGGILAQNSGPQIIGGTYANQGNCCLGNTIAFNGGAGVVVSAGANASYEKGIRGNRIYANEGLGIDLQNNGVTPNDHGDTDGEGMANRLQNFPVITGATVDHGSVVITGTLNSVAEQNFSVDFFANDACDPSGHGEGERFLGFRQVTTEADGNGAFTATFTGTALSLISVGNFVTATATDLDGNTSEFGQCTEATGTGLANNQIFLPLLQR